MRQLMSRLFGLMFGLILYPLRSLILNLGIFIAMPLAVIILNLAFLKKDSLTWNLVLLAFSPLIISVLFVLGESATLFCAFIDLVLSARFAVKTASESGISGVFSRLVTHWRDCSGWLLLTTKAPRRQAEPSHHAEQAVWTDEWQAYDPDQLQDVPKSDLTAAPLPGPEHRTGFKRLTQEECQLAKQNNEDAYKKLYDRYLELQQTIDRLDAAIKAGRDEEGYLMNVDDEIFRRDIKEPCLLFKQVNINGQWQVQLATTFLIDQDSYVEFRKKSNSHPLSRENLDNPLNETGRVRTARYCLVQYKGYCAELHELADRLRDGLQTPEPSPRRSRQSFLAAAGALPFFGESPRRTESHDKQSLLSSSPG